MWSRRQFQQALAGSLGLPLLVGPAAAQAAVPPADLGSLDAELQLLPTSGEFPLSFLQDRFTDPAGWRAIALAKLRELHRHDPPAVAPDPQWRRRDDGAEVIREELTIQTAPGLRVPATLLRPARQERPAPGIVALHDHGAFFVWGREKILHADPQPAVLATFQKQYYGGRAIAWELARQGYVVIAIDAFYWGERRLLVDGDPADWRERPVDLPADRVAAYNQRSSLHADVVQRAIASTGHTWAGMMAVDDLRTVDYLASRPEVDPQRLGCVGLSMGGYRSGQLIAADERIKAAVAVGWMCSFPAQLRSKVRNTLGHMFMVPGLNRFLDYPDIVGLAAPRALLVINGSQDGLFDPAGVQHAFAKLQRIWTKAGAPDKIACRLYDAPHEFNAAMQTAAWAWLRQHLA
ncbi:MAG: dienelactone hydrolase family protein [Fimbriimonadaceae bacterium]|nr:dienelactone hydrolase family protein [Fimbriimonadaceae bacterium]